MKLSRSRFKFALRKCKRDRETVVANNFANKLLANEQRDLWGDIKKHSNCKTKRPLSMDGVHGDENICKMWMHHYSDIFNCVNNSHCDQYHTNICSEQINMCTDMNVPVDEIRSIISELSCNKAPGPDGLNAEHVKYADSRLTILMALMVSAVLIHGHIPALAAESVILPVIKDKNKRISDKCNYRPICLSNILSKMIENVIMNRIDLFLQTTPAQFGFKPKHGTELCVFAFKELIRYYVKHGSAMHVGFLDASKAFDRVNRRKLLFKLEQRLVPTYLLRIISDEFTKQLMHIRWGSFHSDSFAIGNGVKQGGTLSPLFFNVYIDELSILLSEQHIGCCVGDAIVNHLSYADDMIIFSPSAKGLQKLLDICFNYGCEYDILYNAAKSKVMYFESRKADNARIMTLGGNVLTFVDTYKYLGHVIRNDLDDDADMQAKVNMLYAKSNLLRHYFHYCTTDVKRCLFEAYFGNIYLCALWANFKKNMFRRFIVAYNNAYRILHRLPMRCSASFMFAINNVKSCKCLIRRAIFSMKTRVYESINNIIQCIVHSDIYFTSLLRRQWNIMLYNIL